MYLFIYFNAAYSMKYYLICDFYVITSSGKSFSKAPHTPNLCPAYTVTCCVCPLV